MTQSVGFEVTHLLEAQTICQKLKPLTFFENSLTIPAFLVCSSTKPYIGTSVFTTVCLNFPSTLTVPLCQAWTYCSSITSWTSLNMISKVLNRYFSILSNISSPEFFHVGFLIVYLIHGGDNPRLAFGTVPICFTLFIFVFTSRRGLARVVLVFLPLFLVDPAFCRPPSHRGW